MIQVFLLVCSLQTPHADCSRNTAQHFIIAPEAQNNLAMCNVYAQQLAAQTTLIQDGAYLKVRCQYGRRADVD